MDGRPAKKRRFFTQDPSPLSSPLAHRFHRLSESPEPSAGSPPGIPSERVSPTPQSIAPQNKKRSWRAPDPELEGFDVALLESIVGDRLSKSTLLMLKKASNNDVQRGTLFGNL